MPYATDAQDYDAKAWRRQIALVKVYQPSTVNLSGVRCTIYVDKSDPGAAHKVIGIQHGVKRVVDAGFQFPNGIEFYLSSVPGYQSVAYHRDLAPGGGTGRRSVVLLGAGAVNTAGMIGRRGIADAVATRNESTYCACVVVHELGHNLHELLSEDFFWTPNANQPPNVGLALQISQYAATNKKEVVAEVFTGKLYGINYSPAIMNMYNFYEGIPLP